MSKSAKDVKLVSIALSSDDRTLFGVGMDGELVKVTGMKGPVADMSYEFVNDPDQNEIDAKAAAEAEAKRKEEFDKRQAERKAEIAEREAAEQKQQASAKKAATKKTAAKGDEVLDPA